MGGPWEGNDDVGGPNVMMRPRGEGGGQGWEVRLVDLDWAGPEGVARYPLDLNPLAEWAAGVVPGGAMQQRHDVAMLAKALGEALPS